MGMLKSFFENGCDKTLFDGLEIMQESELCSQYMERFPVVSISLNDIGGLTFEATCASIRYIIGMEAMRFPFLAECDQMMVFRLTKRFRLVI